MIALGRHTDEPYDSELREGKTSPHGRSALLFVFTVLFRK